MHWWPHKDGYHFRWDDQRYLKGKSGQAKADHLASVQHTLRQLQQSIHRWDSAPPLDVPLLPWKLLKGSLSRSPRHLANGDVTHWGRGVTALIFLVKKVIEEPCADGPMKQNLEEWLSDEGSTLYLETINIHITISHFQFKLLHPMMLEDAVAFSTPKEIPTVVCSLTAGKLLTTGKSSKNLHTQWLTPVTCARFIR